MGSFLVVFHTPCNAGYAMAALEKVFYQVALNIVGKKTKIHFAFKDLDKAPSKTLPNGFSNLLEINTVKLPEQSKVISSYIEKNGINYALCFDIQPNAPLCKLLRKSGVTSLTSYWGATMSDLNNGLKLFAKKIEVALYKNKPDLFVFESNSMWEHGVNGRGVSAKQSIVIPTGTDTDKYSPAKQNTTYLTEQFSLPENAFVAFYSGHMEERKGVSVIIKSAIELIDNEGHEDIFFLICGNRPGEEQRFLDMLKDKKAADHVIFAGYRNDLDLIMPNCRVGVIASTGWDSFPMSSLEMASSGLPLIVSDLQGLSETIIDKQTGFLFTPGQHNELSKYIAALKSDKDLHKQFSTAGRNRIIDGYSARLQIERLTSAINKTIKH